jgi:hypothetical protein
VARSHGLGLLWGEANQRAELILVLGFPPRAICAEIPKQLSRSAWIWPCKDSTFCLLSQNVVAGLLAEEHEQFADGAVEQLPLLGFGLTRLAVGGFCLPG